MKSNLVVLVSRVLCDHMRVFRWSQRAKHIPHPHSAEIAKKSDVIVCDVLHKNEIDIMMGFLGKEYTHTGGDLLTVELRRD